MSRTIFFISHPNVVISATVPVPQWPLSSEGRTRMERMLTHDWVEELSCIYSSDEQKAIDGAEILGRHTGIDIQCVKELGENDRSSTGFLEPATFESTADRFFASPSVSEQGWETANDAQSRIVKAVKKIERDDTTKGSIAIVSHGAVVSVTMLFDGRMFSVNDGSGYRCTDIPQNVLFRTDHPVGRL